MNNELEKEIQTALMQDVDLSQAEYRKKLAQADANTKAHGVKGRAALTESIRHKRIQSNFYGTTLNILVSLLAETAETNRLIRLLLEQSRIKEGGDDQ